MATRRIVPRLMLDTGGDVSDAVLPFAGDAGSASAQRTGRTSTATVLEPWEPDRPCVVSLRPEGPRLGLGALGSGLAYPEAESLIRPEDDAILPRVAPDGRMLAIRSEERADWLGYVTLADVRLARRWKGRCDRVRLVAHRPYGDPVEVYVDPAELPAISCLKREYFIGKTNDGDAVLVRLGDDAERPAWFVKTSEITGE